MIKSIKPDLKPNKVLVDCLKKALMEAESGELRTFAGVGEYNNQDIARICCFDKNANSFAIIGGLSMLINTIDHAENLSKQGIITIDK